MENASKAAETASEIELNTSAVTFIFVSSAYLK